MKGKPIDPDDLDLLTDEEITIDPNAPACWEVTHMPFGKYRGWRISELPDRYLFWVAKNLDLDGLLREAIEAEIERRRQPAAAATPTPPPLSCEIRAAPPAEGVTVPARAQARYNADNRAAAELILQEPDKHGALLVAWARAIKEEDRTL